VYFSFCFDQSNVIELLPADALSFEHLNILLVFLIIRFYVSPVQQNPHITMMSLSALKLYGLSKRARGLIGLKRVNMISRSQMTTIMFNADLGFACFVCHLVRMPLLTPGKSPHGQHHHCCRLSHEIALVVLFSFTFSYTVFHCGCIIVDVPRWANFRNADVLVLPSFNN